MQSATAMWQGEEDLEIVNPQIAELRDAIIKGHKKTFLENCDKDKCHQATVTCWVILYGEKSL